MIWRILSKPDCPYCVKAKELIEDTGEAYEVIEHTTPELIEAFKARGYKTFPQIFHNGDHIGGYDALKSFLDEMNF
jgi:glutathione-dependent peroxiredoxin